MSDGAIAAPVQPAPPAQAAPATPVDPKAPKTAAKPDPKAPPSWSEKDDADLVERLKRSPYRVKADGKEEGLDSVDSLKRTLLDASRGRGANRLVEGTKKEKEEAAKVRAEAESMRDLVTRARQGDKAARRELGLIPDEERQQTEQEWEALPPEVKALVKQNHEMSERLRQAEEAKAKEMEERTAAEKKAQRDSTLKAAKENAKTILADIKEEFLDAELPDVITAMEALKAESLKFGRDYTVDELKLYVEQMREGGSDGYLKRMKPEAAVKRLAPILKGMTPEALEAALGDDFVPLAKAISKRWVARVHGEKNKKQAAVEKEEKREESKPRTPLMPFRFPGR